ncbi:MAG: hypothetical protein HZC49_14200 [Nitrospirae bacterium]|nr:hypothetical protein [Nitrospirota bacterium]
MSFFGSKSKPPVHRLLPYIFFLMVVIVYSMLTVVVTMLVTGSVHVINDRFIHFEKISIVSILIAAVIIATAVIVFFRKVKNIFGFIEEQVTYRT